MRLASLALLVALAPLAGCSPAPSELAADATGSTGASPPPDASSGPVAAPACVPGAQVACACPGGGTGAQRCHDDGSGFGACLGCAPVPATGSSGGAGGSGGGLEADAGTGGSSSASTAASSSGAPVCYPVDVSACGGRCGTLPDGCGGTLTCPCPYGCTVVGTITACDAADKCSAPPGFYCGADGCSGPWWPDGTLVLAGCTWPPGEYPAGFGPTSSGPWSSGCALPAGGGWGGDPGGCK